MVFYMEKFDGDALTITDEQVAADWRMGLTRAVGRIVAASALPSDRTGSYGATIPGTNRAHVQGGIGQRGCKLVRIYNVKEDCGERYNFDSFGGSTDEVMVLEAVADCECGQLKRHRVRMEVSPGELIYAVTNAD